MSTSTTPRPLDRSTATRRASPSVVPSRAPGRRPHRSTSYFKPSRVHRRHPVHHRRSCLPTYSRTRYTHPSRTRRTRTQNPHTTTHDSTCTPPDPTHTPTRSDIWVPTKRQPRMMIDRVTRRRTTRISRERTSCRTRRWTARRRSSPVSRDTCPSACRDGRRRRRGETRGMGW
jgi:hypothetical protein